MVERIKAFDELKEAFQDIARKVKPMPLHRYRPAQINSPDFLIHSMADSVAAMDYGQVREIGIQLYELACRPGSDNGQPDSADKISNLLYTWAKENQRKRKEEDDLLDVELHRGEDRHDP